MAAISSNPIAGFRMPLSCSVFFTLKQSCRSGGSVKPDNARSGRFLLDAGGAKLGLASSAGRDTMATVIEGRESGFKTKPDYKITFEPSPRRVRVTFNGETIADSTNARLLFETRHLPVYYSPREDVCGELLAPTAHQTFCPYKGRASYWTIRVGDRISENAVWGY